MKRRFMLWRRRRKLRRIKSRNTARAAKGMASHSAAASEIKPEAAFERSPAGTSAGSPASSSASAPASPPSSVLLHKAVPRSRRRNQGRHFGRVLVLLLGLLMLSTLVYGYYRFDRRILPLVLASTDMKLKTAINNAIHTEVQEIIRHHGADATDFYIQSVDPGGSGYVLAVNTVLVNDICNASALAISEKLSSMPPEPVSVPLGMTLGLDTLADTGPRFTFNLSPTGNALVNYDSYFEAVGINQVHFKVWLTVVSTIRIINPVQSSTVTVTREVSLVDTVISGVVPEAYFSMDR